MSGLGEELRHLLDRLDRAEAEERADAVELLRAWLGAESGRAAAAAAAEEVAGRFGMVGKAPAMEEVYGVLAKVARTHVPVLVVGESGTGKELAARALHEQGPRRRGPWVAVNCAAIPPTLLEAELFGHVKGAFTGAHRDRRGYVAEADGGTLFLDEVGEIPPELQAKLLRFLQEGEYRPVGASKVEHAEVRVVAATNRDLKRAIADGRFREDLYYRLAVITVRMPPLRERREDVPALARDFLARQAERGEPSAEVTDEAMALLQAHDWPGNVRELQNELQRAATFARDGRITPAELSPALRGEG